MTIELPTIGAVMAAFTLYQSVCWLLDRFQIGEKRKQHALLMSAQMNMMRELLRSSHKECMEKGSIDEDELEHIEKVYSTYHALHGNGTGDRWMEEMRGLPRTH